MSKEKALQRRLAQANETIKKLRAELSVRDTPWTPFVQVGQEKELGDLIFSATFANSRYQVMVRKVDPLKENDSIVKLVEFSDDFGPIIHLSIKRIDRSSYVPWRDLQRIKNEICGDQSEAIMLNPAEKRLVDTANQYHLWVLPEGQFWPVGWMSRVVSETTSIPGVVQDKWEDSQSRPSDLIHIDTLDTMRAKLKQNAVT